MQTEVNRDCQQSTVIYNCRFGITLMGASAGFNVLDFVQFNLIFWSLLELILLKKRCLRALGCD
jgi:hypothetical protein